ncbi:hypothetical protein RN001_002527 [Aquatica leii]|uniref:Uncharacterized protein n=1 Tax=Aquatica leii TaxID=1421715 RepID=A0AAN7PMH6_9COLE|nr:hypothetical protein RN001_002527 [Aquatica leii]
MSPEKVYANCRVCALHFVKSSFGANNRLTRTAYPQLKLPDNLVPIIDIDLTLADENHGISISVPHEVEDSTVTEKLLIMDDPLPPSTEAISIAESHGEYFPKIVERSDVLATQPSYGGLIKMGWKTSSAKCDKEAADM